MSSSLEFSLFPDRFQIRRAPAQSLPPQLRSLFVSETSTLLFTPPSPGTIGVLIHVWSLLGCVFALLNFFYDMFLAGQWRVDPVRRCFTARPIDQLNAMRLTAQASGLFGVLSFLAVFLYFRCLSAYGWFLWWWARRNAGFVFISLCESIAYLLYKGPQASVLAHLVLSGGFTGPIYAGLDFLVLLQTPRNLRTVLFFIALQTLDLLVSNMIVTVELNQCGADKVRMSDAQYLASVAFRFFGSMYVIRFLKLVYSKLRRPAHPATEYRREASVTAAYRCAVARGTPALVILEAGKLTACAAADQVPPPPAGGGVVLEFSVPPAFPRAALGLLSAFLLTVAAAETYLAVARLASMRLKFSERCWESNLEERAEILIDAGILAGHGLFWGLGCLLLYRSKLLGVFFVFTRWWFSRNLLFLAITLLDAGLILASSRSPTALFSVPDLALFSVLIFPALDFVTMTTPGGGGSGGSGGGGVDSSNRSSPGPALPPTVELAEAPEARIELEDRPAPGSLGSRRTLLLSISMKLLLVVIGFVAVVRYVNAVARGNPCLPSPGGAGSGGASSGSVASFAVSAASITMASMQAYRTLLQCSKKFLWTELYNVEFDPTGRFRDLRNEAAMMQI